VASAFGQRYDSFVAAQMACQPDDETRVLGRSRRDAFGNVAFGVARGNEQKRHHGQPPHSPDNSTINPLGDIGLRELQETWLDRHERTKAGHVAGQRKELSHTRRVPRPVPDE
jgi:hypothetical protein